MSPRADGTVSPEEHAVLEMLRGGPALLGPRTEEYEVRRPPRLYPIVHADGSVDRGGGDHRVEHVRLVDAKVARRLAAVTPPLVVIDAGAMAFLPDQAPL